MNQFYRQLCEIVSPEQILREEPMSRHTTFGVGGPADFLIEPAHMQAIHALVTLCQHTQTPLTVIGKGSNVLVKSGGIRGLVLKIAERFSQILPGESPQSVIAQAGISNWDLADALCERGLSGYEFASGIPGTVGGAATMNAGAYGGEISQVLQSVDVINRQGQMLHLPASTLCLGYRTSRIMREQLIVLGVTLQLQAQSPSVIRSTMEELEQRRRDRQPLEQKSAGSTFKRPPGHYAGALIQEAGLAGLCMRGAAVSEKHCGFVINKKDASCEDILDLIELIKLRVFDHSGVWLEEEVRIIGEDA